MKRCPEDLEFTESVDVLMPNVGEITGALSLHRIYCWSVLISVRSGGSMRIADMAELMEGYKREGINPTPYYWFSDQRKYGTCEHGGYGLGVEVRFPTAVDWRELMRRIAIVGLVDQQIHGQGMVSLFLCIS